MVTLQQNVTAINTAQALYYLRSEYHGIAILPWEALTPATRQMWVETAQGVLEDLAPNPALARPDYFSQAAALARTQATKVIGQITAGVPSGEAA